MSGKTHFIHGGMYRRLIALMLPIILQNLISAIVNSADVFMLSSVGQTALSAASLAGQITFVLTLFHWGICAGTTMMASQYYGKREMTVIRQIQGFAFLLLLIVSGVFFFACLCVPQMLMRIFTADAQLIRLGAHFLRVLGVSYIPMSASQALLAIFKSVGKTRLSAIISTLCLLTNISLNFVSIRVLFPHDPQLAMIGVAAATVIARLFELALCLLAIRRGSGVPFSPKDCLRVPGWLVRDFARLTAPVQANNLIAGLALAALTAIMGRMGSDMVSANAIASNLRELVCVACMALGTAGSILLGQEMGAGRMQEAKALGKSLEVASLVLGVLAGLVLMLIRRPVIALCGLEGEAATLLHQMIPICAAYCVGRSYNSCLISGIFCAGGDTRFGLILDAITMWVLVLPAALLAAFVWKLPPVLVYFFLNTDEFYKMPPSAWRLRRYRWLRNLTRHEI